MTQKISESFEWADPLIEKYKELSNGGRLYKVKAIHVTMTGNKRYYRAEELLRSGRSLADRPININHNEVLFFDGQNKILDNRTLDSEYNEKEQCVETLVRIMDPRINALFDEGKIKHVSIEGKARDADEVDGIAPMGVIFTGLAFVTDDKTPGDPASSVQVAETVKFSEIILATSEPHDTKSEAEKAIEDFKTMVTNAKVVDVTQTATMPIPLGEPFAQ